MLNVSGVNGRVERFDEVPVTYLAADFKVVDKVLTVSRDGEGDDGPLAWYSEASWAAVIFGVEAE